MEFLDKLIVPQPENNLILLNYFLMIGLSIFLVYTGSLFGSMILSVYFKGKSKSNQFGSQMAKDYSSIATDKLFYGFGVGLFSLLSIIFIYAQLLHKVNISVVSFLSTGLWIYIVALVLLYFYNSMYKSANKGASGIKTISGWIGVVLLAVAMMIIIGAISITTDKTLWANKDIVSVMFSPRSLLNFVQFIVASLGVVAIAFVYFNIYWNNEQEYTEEYKTYTVQYNSWFALFMSLILPIFFLIGIFTTSKQSLSVEFFCVSALGLILLFLALHSIYGVLKTNKLHLVKYAFLFYVVSFALLVSKDKFAFSVANQDHLLVLHDEYLDYESELLASMGIETSAVSGEEVYNRCKACHGADDSPVAPAHKNIMPKYLEMSEGKAALMKFIGNPVPVNPKWNPMPNQGLKPSELEAVVDYMWAKYGGEGSDVEGATSGGEEPAPENNEQGE